MRLIGANSENKEATRRPPWLTDGIADRGFCTLILSVVSTSYQKYQSWARSPPPTDATTGKPVGYLFIICERLSRNVQTFAANQMLCAAVASVL